MDPITQGALGAVLPQATATRRKGAVALAGLFGFIAGMAADLDVFIRSDSDPLLFLEYHRQFTHALIFIPLGGLVSATLLYCLTRPLGERWRLPFLRIFLFCTLGYGTHGLLDFATSYGTMLFWPFSEERYSASIISIVDPVFTMPVLSLVILAAVRRSSVFARWAMGWAALYLGLGVLQHNVARDAAADLAAERGHEIERLTVKPSFGNILVWRSVYQASDRFYVDAVRVGVSPRIYPGTSVARLNPRRDFPWLTPGSQQSRDLVRFDRFSKGYTARAPGAPDTVIDVRFAFLPNELGALWSIALTPDAAPNQHVRFQTNRRDARKNLTTLWRMIVDRRENR